MVAASEPRAFEDAHRHRATLDRPVFIGITGSCGKTTTKDLIAALLSTRFRTRKSEGTLNCGLDLARSVLSVRQDDAFLVQEMGAWGAGTLEPAIALVRPRIAVVTNLRNDHYSSFHGPRGAQAEKGKLVASLPPDGTAVLNWDDPLVRELAAWTSASVVSFGRSDEAELRAWDVGASWPQRLSFRVAYRGESRRVETRLLGEHLLGSALAALAVGLRCGLSLDEATSALRTVPPSFRRMSPVSLGSVVFIRDDYKAPADSLPEVLAFMRDARAERKLAVIGRIADIAGRSRPTYTQVARQALAILDTTIFVGARATELWGTHTSLAVDDQQRRRHQIAGADGGAMLVFETVEHTAHFLHHYLRSGDLVLLKGSGPADHLERVLLDREAPVSCWETSCGRTDACDACALLRAAG
jgi:UDP-N-acetylmuramoyl-tripeptide--D-alanyl-D-alanine ligase